MVERVSHLLVHRVTFVCLQSTRKVFGGSTEVDEDLLEGARDAEGPSMRERLDNERQERMRAAGN